MQLELVPVLSARTVVRVSRLARYSLETQRDARWPVEPLGADEVARRRHVTLRAAMVLAGTFEPLPGLPGPTRASCPPDRHEAGCPFARCRHHLWRVDGGIDGTRAGRPGLSLVRRDARGRTTVQLGDTLGDRPGTTLEARWLEHPLPVSCALDVADTGPSSNERVGRAIGRHRTLVARLVRAALGLALDHAEELGADRVAALALLTRQPPADR